MELPWKPEGKEAVVKDDWLSILAGEAGYQSPFLPVALMSAHVWLLRMAPAESMTKGLGGPRIHRSWS